MRIIKSDSDGNTDSNAHADSDTHSDTNARANIVDYQRAGEFRWRTFPGSESN